MGTFFLEWRRLLNCSAAEACCFLFARRVGKNRVLAESRLPFHFHLTAKIEAVLGFDLRPIPSREGGSNAHTGKRITGYGKPLLERAVRRFTPVLCARLRTALQGRSQRTKWPQSLHDRAKHIRQRSLLQGFGACLSIDFRIRLGACLRLRDFFPAVESFKEPFFVAKVVQQFEVLAHGFLWSAV